MMVSLHRACRAIAILAALGLGSVGVVRGTWAVGGSDSSCYALMSDAFAAARLQPTSALALEAPWPAAALTLAPAGFQPSPVRSDAASPICAPGFSLVLAPFRWLGGKDAIFLVSPVAGIALVWLVFVFARALGGYAAGALAAVLVATSPIVLYQVVQPMNDVATVAATMAVLVASLVPGARGAVLMGAAAGAALLIRPNLAPIALVVGLWIIVSGRGLSRDREGRGRRRIEWPPAGAEVTRRAVCFVGGLAPFLLAIAWLNAALYGSPIRSGYGEARELFSLAFLPVNAAGYGAALIETQTPFPLLAFFAPMLCSRPRRDVCWLALALAATVIAIYLLYRPFPEWWYIRFLLPALVMALALSAVVVAGLLERLKGQHAVIAGALLAAMLAFFGIRTAMARQAFALRDLEARFRDATDVVRDRLSPSTVVITVWESGSVRFHAGRETVLWDSLDPRWLDGAVQWLQARKRPPVILVERWEEPLFRQRFGEHAALGGLDWPPRFDVERQVRIFDPADRPAYVGGAFVPTEHVRRR